MTLRSNGIKAAPRGSEAVGSPGREPPERGRCPRAYPAFRPIVSCKVPIGQTTHQARGL